MVGEETLVTRCGVAKDTVVSGDETGTCVLLVDDLDVEFETFKDGKIDRGVDAEGGCVSSICELLRGGGEL